MRLTRHPDVPLACMMAAQPAAAGVRLLADGSSTEEWHTNADGVRLTTAGDGLEVVIAPSASSRRIHLEPQTLANLTVPSVRRVQIDATATATIGLGVQLADLRGRPLHLPIRSVSDTVWALAEDAVGPMPPEAEAGLALVALLLEVPPTDVPTTVRLHVVLAEIDATPAAQIRVVAEAPGPANTCSPEDRGAVRLRCANPTGEALSGSLVVQATDGWGRGLGERRVGLQLAAGASIELPLDWALPGLGWTGLAWRLEADGSTVVSGRDAIACIPTPRPCALRTSSFHFAVCGGITDTPAPWECRHELIAAARIGLDCIRDHLRWEDAQPKPGPFSQRQLDWWSACVDQAAALGIELQAILCYNAKWAADPSTHGDMQAWQKSPPPSAPWLEYVDAILHRLGDRVRWWEVWNEPDITHFWRGSADEYLDLLRLTSARIRAEGPEHRVLTGGFATIGEHGGKREPDLQDRVMAEGAAWYDVVAHHQHGRYDDFAEQIEERLMPLVRRRTDKGLWFNETAIHRKEVGATVQAAVLVKKLAHAMALGAMGYTWFKLVSGDLDDRGWHHWGLLSRDHRPFPVYVAYANAIALLRDSKPDGRLDRGPGRYGFRFTATDRHVTVLWDEDPWAGRQALAFAVDADASVETVDLFGSRKPLLVHQGIAIVVPGDMPIFLVSSTAIAPRLLPPLADGQRQEPVVPGRASRLALEVADPAGAGRTPEVSWFDGVADGRWTPPSTLSHAYGRPLLRSVRVALPGTPLAADIDLAIPVAILVPPDAPERPADLVLDDAAQVYNRFAFVPQLDAFTWQGPHDLSLQAWFARDAAGIELRLAVIDDSHEPDMEHADQGDLAEAILSLDGRTTMACQMRLGPDGVADIPLARGLDRSALQLDARRDTSVTRYRLRIPWSALGADPLRELVLRVNVAALDRDGGRAKGWIQAAPRLYHWERTARPSLMPVVILPVPVC